MEQSTHGAHFASKPEKHSSRGPIIVLSIAFAVIFAIYLGGVAYFSFFFMPSTTLDGQDVSLMSVNDVATSLSTTKVSGWKATVSGDGVSFDLAAADVSLAYDGEAAARAAIAQQRPWAWPVELAQGKDQSLSTGDASTYVSLDPTGISTALANAVSAVAAADDGTNTTGISYDSEKKAYVASGTAQANRINQASATQTIAEKVRSLATSIELGDESLQGGESVDAALSTANAMLGATVTLTLGGTEVTTVDADLISQWVTIGDDLSITLDQDAITTWAKGDLSAKTDSVGTARTYTRPDGVQESVAAGGVYGWSINGIEAAQDIYRNIVSGSPTTLELPCYDSAATYNPGGQDWPTRFIDVDISDQHAIFFDSDGSVIWEADIVTGQPNLNRSTTQGTWTITNKQSPSTLVGPNNESGNPQWVSHVDFWMGVVGNLMGFHNAPWRSAFGGDIYLTNGSHGCINLSYEKGEQLYSLCNVGDVVIIHE
ncbi:L,D-transpeptidase [Olsenella sp. Marseille-P4559]|uniref:L,D-transpeptidase n=1 Tax=Olsenella sp. Marseille-P4559 TaxID=2364795 RepID=UPI00102F624C|nr:L,D-transpeptidase [Olsenella sp. Marseille-P4559]